MLKLYTNQTLTFPNLKEYTYEELAASPQYAILTQKQCVINIDEDGITHSFNLLSALKNDYNVTDEDAETALSNIEKAIEQNRKEQTSLAISLESLQDTDSIHDQAIGELGVSTATLLESNTQLTASNADVLQAIGELGAMVAAMQVSPDTPSHESGEIA